MNNGNTPDNWFKQILETFREDQKEDIRRIWNEAEHTDESTGIKLSEEEKNDIFSQIAAEAGFDPSDQSELDRPARITPINWKWVAAAAVVIIAAGLSYLTIPVKVTAPYGEMTSVHLSDESRVTLNSGSSISYNRLYNILDRDISLNGEAFFEVKEGELPFIVHTSNASIKVLGTSFNIRSWQDEPVPETTVFLTEGSLQFYPAGQPERSVNLEPGQKSNLRNLNGTPAQPEEFSKNRSLAWLENQFAFEDMPLVSIMKEIERRFDLSIEVKPREVWFDTLTIYYNKRVSAEQIIRDICQSKALNYRKVNGGFVIEE